MNIRLELLELLELLEALKAVSRRFFEILCKYFSRIFLVIMRLQFTEIAAPKIIFQPNRFQCRS